VSVCIVRRRLVIAVVAPTTLTLVAIHFHVTFGRQQRPATAASSHWLTGTGTERRAPGGNCLWHRIAPLRPSFRPSVATPAARPAGRSVLPPDAVLSPSAAVDRRGTIAGCCSLVERTPSSGDGGGGTRHRRRPVPFRRPRRRRRRQQQLQSKQLCSQTRLLLMLRRWRRRLVPCAVGGVMFN